MRIRISGEESGRAKSYEYNLLDRTDKATQTLSMARTTGYTCTAAANLVLEGQFTRKGICPPEYLGEEEAHFSFIVDYLRKRGVHYSVKN
jgi:saccharopine dehydrogenase-like NADP-dependent oxidoreductase